MPAYYIDFDSWILNGKSPYDVAKKAIKLLKEGRVPNISNVDHYDGKHKNELYDYIDLNKEGGKSNGSQTTDS